MLIAGVNHRPPLKQTDIKFFLSRSVATRSCACPWASKSRAPYQDGELCSVEPSYGAVSSPMPLFAPVITRVFFHGVLPYCFSKFPVVPTPNLSRRLRSGKSGCGFVGNSSTSRSFFVIARERTATLSMSLDA